jgi:hypothetical protein
MKRETAMNIRSIISCAALVLLATLLVSSVNAGITGTYVDAWPLHDPEGGGPGNTVRTSDGDDGTGNVWYKGPESAWTGNDADRWYLESPDGGHNSAGVPGRNGDHYTWYEETRYNVPGITTTISGLDPGSYDVYVQYGSNASDGWGVYAAFSGGAQQPYNASNGTLTDAPGGITYYESLVGNIDAVGGKISVDITEYAGVFPGGARTYYDGLSYEQTAVIPEPSSLLLAVIGLLGLTFATFRRRRRSRA